MQSDSKSGQKSEPRADSRSEIKADPKSTRDNSRRPSSSSQKSTKSDNSSGTKTEVVIPNEQSNMVQSNQTSTATATASNNTNSATNSTAGTVKSVTGTGTGSQTIFIHKLYNMLEDDTLSHLIFWSESGDSFHIMPGEEFSNVLSQYFKHTNISSFIRQLNMYGFHKVNDSSQSSADNADDSSHPALAQSHANLWEFKHSTGNFRKGDAESLKNIKRRSSKHTSKEPKQTGQVPWKYETTQTDESSLAVQEEIPGNSIRAGHSAINLQNGPTLYLPQASSQLRHLSIEYADLESMRERNFYSQTSDSFANSRSQSLTEFRFSPAHTGTPPRKASDFSTSGYTRPVVNAAAAAGPTPMSMPHPKTGGSPYAATAPAAHPQAGPWMEMNSVKAPPDRVSFLESKVFELTEKVTTLTQDYSQLLSKYDQVVEDLSKTKSDMLFLLRSIAHRSDQQNPSAGSTTDPEYMKPGLGLESLLNGGSQRAAPVSSTSVPVFGPANMPAPIPTDVQSVPINSHVQPAHQGLNCNNKRPAAAQKLAEDRMKMRTPPGRRLEQSEEPSPQSAPPRATSGLSRSVIPGPALEADQERTRNISGWSRPIHEPGWSEIQFGGAAKGRVPSIFCDPLAKNPSQGPAVGSTGNSVTIKTNGTTHAESESSSNGTEQSLPTSDTGKSNGSDEVQTALNCNADLRRVSVAFVGNGGNLGSDFALVGLRGKNSRRIEGEAKRLEIANSSSVHSLLN